jgi:dTDP-glucose 4,6-dehydratase/UDP-glucuronate decarboxylase
MYNFEIIKKDCERLFEKIDCTKLKNKKVLITGANGLIGSFLADFFMFLNEKKYNISIILTSFSTSDKVERIKHLLSNEMVSYFSWDASTKIDLVNLDNNIEYIFFCSGYGQPSKFTKDNIKTSFINTVGVNSLLEFLSSNDKRGNFMFLSTSEVYGDPDDKNIPTKENYNGNYSINNNRSSYIVSKRLGEVICNDYARNYDLNIKIARVGLVYGPGVLHNDERVLQDFIFKAKNNKKITLLDSGNSLRNYLYITDGIEIILNLILNSTNTDTTYNVGGDLEPITIYELSQKISNIFGCEVEKGKDKQNHIVQNSPKNVYLCMDKYRKEFNIKNNGYIPLDKGLYNVIKWYNFI